MGEIYTAGCSQATLKLPTKLAKPIATTWRQRSDGCSAEGFAAFGAGADAAKMVVAVDAGSVAVGEGDLDGVIAHRSGGFRARFGLKHRQRRRRDRTRAGTGALPYPLVIARGAGTFVAKIREIVVAGVAVGPQDVDTGAAGYVNLHAGGLFPGVDGNGHELVRS